MTQAGAVVQTPSEAMVTGEVLSPDDYPGSLGDVAVRARRVAMLDRPPMRPLAGRVRALRADGRGYVPDFDPLDGGTAARLLFLLEKPGPRTVPPAGSGFVSRNTDDPTAKACRAFMLEAGIDRRDTAIWNTVPWWNGTMALTGAELRDGAAALRETVRLLPALRGVVLVGNRAAEHGAPALDGLGLTLFRTVHPGMQARNGKHSRDRWLAIPALWREAWQAVAD